jgi:prepilin signal peptidase PulO-like enzyme (type II secretory pathway)
MPEINGKALVRGIVLFLVLYVIHVVFLPQLVGEQAATGEYQGLLYGINQALGLATCLIPGFLAAKIAGHHGFIHGGLVGGVSTILTALIAMIWAIATGGKFFGLETLPFWLVINMFLSAFAGLIATNLEEPEPQD